jgi:hypothetical protein
MYEIRFYRNKGGIIKQIAVKTGKPAAKNLKNNKKHPSAKQLNEPDLFIG